MKDWHKPKLFISRCLLNIPCRYNGIGAPDKIIDKLEPYIEIVETCPEQAIGLPTPRETLRLVKIEEGIRLLKSNNDEDLTESMSNFSKDYLCNLGEVDGFLLKGKSPSCGLKEVRVYTSIKKGSISTKGNGLFASEVIKLYNGIPIEDEGRLKNFNIREHFFNRIFTLSHFRYVKSLRNITYLIRFHSNNKLLFMAYNQKELKKLGNIVANHDKKEINELLKDYEMQLLKVLSKTPRYTSNINMLMHAFGYLSKGLSKEEKAFILELIEKYRIGKVPLSVPTNVIKAQAIRFKENYLLSQSFLEPYPEELMDISDSGKGVSH
ncbi:YbgA family protein [Desnuesiella massiliensis]|uniref:YbgA family protein n=1 Tax=Desnuesiella massiliensis TaxID=1650662 RepID=UPI0006E46BDC|nr:DUF523 and DUF1722 domain-containing protein [Desnuesiella massiliensis]